MEVDFDSYFNSAMSLWFLIMKRQSILNKEKEVKVGRQGYHSDFPSKCIYFLEKYDLINNY